MRLAVSALLRASSVIRKQALAIGEGRLELGASEIRRAVGSPFLREQAKAIHLHAPLLAGVPKDEDHAGEKRRVEMWIASPARASAARAERRARSRRRRLGGGGDRSAASHAASASIRAGSRLIGEGRLELGAGEIRRAVGSPFLREQAEAIHLHAPLLAGVPKDEDHAGERAVPISRMGAALSSMVIAVPSRRRRSVWFASATMVPSRSSLATGLSIGARVSSSTIGNTALSI